MIKAANNWFNILTGASCGAAALFSFFSAINTPWNVNYYTASEGYSKDNIVKLDMPPPTKLDSTEDKVNGVLYYIHQYTLGKNTKYIVNIDCLKEFAGLTKEQLQGAIRHIDFNQNSNIKPEFTKNDFAVQLENFFTNNAEMKIIQDNKQIDINHVYYSSTKATIYDTVKDLSAQQVISGVTQCYSINS